MVALVFTKPYRLYLDTNIFIYALEGFPEYVDEIKRLFDAIDHKVFKGVTSELTLSEVLVKPSIDQNHELKAVYLEAIRTSDVLEVVPISREVLIEAANLRAFTRMKLPDAIHAATARLTGC